MLKLKNVLQKINRRQADLAKALGVSPATVAQIVNHNKWPKSLNESNLRNRIGNFLKAHGALEDDLSSAFYEVNQVIKEVSEPPRVLADTAARSVSRSKTGSKTTTEPNQEESMLLRKQTLRQATRKHFELFRDPFLEDVQSHEDVFMSADIRYVREAMLQTAKHGGFDAIVGESGAGKSTLRRDLIDRIQREELPIVVIEPYVIAMEDNDQKGKTLKAMHIAEAILATVAPLENPKRSSEARFRQLHRVLRDSRRTGRSHVLVIEEAHALPIPTLKHLKRFMELEDGFKKLLGIILIGQPELAMKLSEQSQEAREVVQRCHVVTLAPLSDGKLHDYLKFKLDRIGKPLSELIDDGGIAAIRERLTIPGRRQGQNNVSLLYPLAVGNLLTASMNLAADIGSPVVNADVVKAV